MRYAYDLRGLQTSVWFTGISQGFDNAYDGFGRLVSTTSSMGGFSRTVSHAYDDDGLETELTFPDGQKFWTRRDGLGRATEIYQGAFGSTATIMVAFAFDPASRLSYFSRRFGDNSAFAYDGVGRLSVLEDGFPAGIGNTRSDFHYNPAGQLARESRSNDDYAWKGSVGLTRDYGAANGLNQYSSTTSDGAPSAAFSYDADHDPSGCRLLRPAPVTDSGPRPLHKDPRKPGAGTSRSVPASPAARSRARPDRHVRPAGNRPVPPQWNRPWPPIGCPRLCSTLRRG